MMSLRIVLCFLCSIFVICDSGICFSGELAVVVNKSNPVDGLSFEELQDIFRAKKQFWDGGKIYLLVRDPHFKEYEQMLKLIYGFESEGEFKKFWLGKIYRGEIGMLPKVSYSDTSVKRMVEKISSAIGVISLESVDDTVKVLNIDGKAPSDKGYKLSF